MMNDLAQLRITPMARMMVARAPEKAPARAPTDREVHGHLNNAKKANTDGDKRLHVFKALTALNRRAKAGMQSPPGDASGAT